MMEDSRVWCPFCKQRFHEKLKLVDHQKTQRHRLNYCAELYSQHQSELIVPKDGLEVVWGNASDGEEVMTQDGSITWNVSKTPPQSQLTLVIKNGHPKDQQQKLGLMLRSVDFLKSDTNFQLTDECGLTQQKEKGVLICNGDEFPIHIDLVNKQLGQAKLILLLFFTKDDHRTTLLMFAKEILVQVTDAEVDQLQPIAPYQKQTWTSLWHSTSTPVPGVALPYQGPSDVLRSTRSDLQKYGMDKDTELLLSHGLKPFHGITLAQNQKRHHFLDILQEKTVHNHVARLTLLIQAEECQMKVDVKSYDLVQVPVRYAKGSKSLLKIDVPGLAENRPSVLKGDQICTILGDRLYNGVVHAVQQSSIHVGFHKSLLNQFINGMKLNIRFSVNPYPWKVMYRALLLLSDSPDGLQRIHPVQDRDPLAPAQMNCLSFFNRKIESNTEQQTAVIQILNGGMKGIPYIIFGPPGTGKTVTLVEAIHQVNGTIFLMTWMNELLLFSRFGVIGRRAE